MGPGRCTRNQLGVVLFWYSMLFAIHCCITHDRPTMCTPVKTCIAPFRPCSNGWCATCVIAKFQIMICIDLRPTLSHIFDSTVQYCTVDLDVASSHVDQVSKDSSEARESRCDLRKQSIRMQRLWFPYALATLTRQTVSLSSWYYSTVSPIWRDFETLTDANYTTRFIDEYYLYPVRIRWK